MWLPSGRCGGRVGLLIALENRQGSFAQAFGFLQSPSHKVGRRLSVSRHNRRFGNAGKTHQEISHSPGVELLERIVTRGLEYSLFASSFKPVGNQIRQFRLTICHSEQFLLIVGNQPSTLATSQRDVKRTAIGAVFFIAKDVASPYVLSEAPGTNGRGEDVEA